MEISKNESFQDTEKISKFFFFFCIDILSDLGT